MNEERPPIGDISINRQAFRESMRPKRHLEFDEYEPGGKFRCPYCGMLKDSDEQNWRTRIDNVRFGLGPWFMPNWYKVTAEKQETPICSSCLAIFDSANTKAKTIAIIVSLVVLAIILLAWYLSDSSHKDDVWMILLIPLLYIFIKRTLLCKYVKKEGIKYNAS